MKSGHFINLALLKFLRTKKLSEKLWRRRSTMNKKNFHCTNTKWSCTLITLIVIVFVVIVWHASLRQWVVRWAACRSRRSHWTWRSLYSWRALGSRRSGGSCRSWWSRRSWHTVRSWTCSINTRTNQMTVTNLSEKISRKLQYCWTFALHVW